MPQVAFRMSDADKDSLDRALFERGKLSLQDVLHALAMAWIRGEVNVNGFKAKPGEVEVPEPEGTQIMEKVADLSIRMKEIEEIVNKLKIIKR